MDEGPHSPTPQPRSSGQTRVRPLSPHLSIYRWPITMAASITHRATGIALSAGTLLLAWWLIAAATGPEAYAVFAAVARGLPGQIVLFGFLWSLAFHLLSGIRHLAWDVGYGFKVPAAKMTAALVYVGSLILAVSAFAVGLMVRGGLGT
jgi:succinate dehydrogenase / fumarate reductase cytochrome b subunit